jgi:hypothetical protein
MTNIPLSAKERLEQARRELDAMRRKLNRGTFFTALIGIALLAVLGVYFYIGYKAAKDLMVPKNLVTFGKEILDKDILPDVRKTAEKEVPKLSVDLAKDLSKRLQNYLPEGRKKLEAFIIEQMDPTIEKLNLMAEDEFRKVLNEHRKEVEEAFKELAASTKSTKSAEKALDKVVKALEDEIKLNLQDEAYDILDTLKTANESWRDMAYNDKNLSEEAKRWQKLWMLTRLVWLKEAEGKTILPEWKDLRIKVLGTVKSVDAEKNTLTVMVRRGKKEEARTYKVTKGINLKDSAANLPEGTQVELRLAPRDPESVVSIIPRKAKKK